MVILKKQKKEYNSYLIGSRVNIIYVHITYL